MKCNGHLTFQCVIDYRGVRLDAIFFILWNVWCHAVVHVDSVVIIVLLK